MNHDNLVFLDYNSTTPIDPRVFDAMLPFLKHDFANPNSNHHFGQFINRRVDEARELIADFINADSSELIFTSGATEAINMAIKGVAECYSSKGKHIITVSTEHKAVIDTCHDLERKGFEITYLPVQQSGLIDLDDLDRALRPDTILVAVMHVNNETGVTQPIKEVASIVHAKGSIFMTDATQSVGKLEIDVDDLDVDLLCFSGHKMYAPKGIGALFVRQRGAKIKLTPQTHGGGHEQGLRSGTLNVPGIIALGRACEIARQEMTQDQVRIADLRDRLESELLQLSVASINGSIDNRVFNTSSICFKGHDANVLIGRMKDIAVSNGAACSSAVVEPSHVLKAMGLSDEDAFSTIRFSLGKYSTIDDIDFVVDKLTKLITPNHSDA